MLVVHATRALRERIPEPAAHDESTTTLGPWYATRLRWRRPAVLLVNGRRCSHCSCQWHRPHPCLLECPTPIAELLLHHHVPAVFVTAEHAAMTPIRLAPTADRSVVGILNEVLIGSGSPVLNGRAEFWNDMCRDVASLTTLRHSLTA